MVDGAYRDIAVPGYTVLACLSDGASGLGLKARADVTGDLAVIHVYPEASAELRAAFSRFIPHFELSRETFRFERVLRVREMGVKAAFCYCISDHVEGYDVADWLKRKGVLDESDVMLVGQYAVEALAHVWNTGRVVHGDLKLTDLLVAETGDVKLRYFSSYESIMAAARHSGLARPHGPYVAPEVRKGHSAPTPQSDMYALGMVLLHVLTGVRPPADLVPAVPGNAANMVLTGSVSVSRPLTMLLRKLTAANPLARYHNWSGLLADMALIEKGHAPDIEVSPASEKRIQGMRRPVPRRRSARRKVVRVALGVYVVVVSMASLVCHLAFRGETIPPKPKGRARPLAVLEERLASVLIPDPEPLRMDPVLSPSVEGPPVVELEIHPEKAHGGAPPLPAVPVVAPAWTVPVAYPPEGVEDYVLIMHDVMRLGKERRFEEAGAMLDRWLAMNPESPYHGHVEDEKRRLGIVMAAFDRLLAARMLVRGASIETQPGLRGDVTDVRDGQFLVVLKYERGEVEVGISLRAVTEHDLSTLLKRVSPATYAEDMALYLAAGGQVEALDKLTRKAGLTEPLLGSLHALASNRRFLSDNLQSLDTLVRIRQLVDAGLYEVAREALSAAQRAYAATMVFTQLRKKDVDLLEKQIADGFAESDSVLTDGKEFSVGTVRKPDRRSKRKLAFKMAIEKGRWVEYIDSLEGVLLSVLKTRASSSRIRQYERVLAEDTMRNALNQAAFVHAVTPAILAGFSGESEQAFLRWLLRKDDVLDALLRTVKPEDDLNRVLQVWQELWRRDPETRDRYFNLALACAVVFDGPAHIFPGQETRAGAEHAGAAKASPAQAVDFRHRYDFYRESDQQRRLRVRLEKLPASDLIWVVDAPVPETELRWAQDHVNYSRRDWGRAYGHVRYRMDKARGELADPLYEEYTLDQIEKHGGVCSDQAYFCVTSAKANGIPAMVISGDGQRGPHAWAGHKATDREWDLTTGRYSGYPVGMTRDPQTGRMIKGGELSILADPQRRVASDEQVNLYLRLADLFARNARLDEARQAFRMALDLGAQHPLTWDAYVAFLRQTNAGPEVWEDVIGELRKSFRGHSDMLVHADRLEEEMLFPYMDPSDISKSLRSRLRRMDYGQGDRAALLCESIRRQVGILERSGDVDGVIRIYEEGLTDLGGEKTSFVELSNSVFSYAESQGRGHEAMQIIDRAFRRHFPGSHGDYFYMKEHQKLLFWLADLHERDGGQGKADRYRRDADRISRRL